jgi:membrane-associated phospholipid phosphatase
MADPLADPRDGADWPLPVGDAAASDASGPRIRRHEARRLVLAAALLLAAFAAMLVLVAGFDGPPRIDTAVQQWFVGHRTSALTAFFRVVTTIGSPVGVALTTAAVLGVLCVRRRSVWPPLLGAVALIGAELIGSILKVVVGRARPPLPDRVPSVSATGFDFPSGHSTQSAAAYLVLALLLAEGINGPRRRALLYGATAVAAGLVGVSRIYLGVHWFTDVTASWCLGLGWTYAVVAGAAWWGRPPRTAPPRDAAGDN